jgi:hypothetical protein
LPKPRATRILIRPFSLRWKNLPRVVRFPVWTGFRLTACVASKALPSAQRQPIPNLLDFQQLTERVQIFRHIRMRIA